MKFGKRLRDQVEVTLPDWRNKFLCYKELKKRLKMISASEQLSQSKSNNDLEDREFSGTTCDKAEENFLNGDSNVKPENLEEHFIRSLYVELEKFNNFFMEKEEDFIIRFHSLKERIRRMKATSGEDEDSTEFDEVTKALVAFHGEMILLENYSSLNYTGLVKILKKYDKRTGHLIRQPFIKNVSRQPFYTTELLSRLIKDCEDEMLSLFPVSTSLNGESEKCCNVMDQDPIQVDNPDKDLGCGQDWLRDQDSVPDQYLECDPSVSPNLESASFKDSALHSEDYSIVYKSTLAALQSLQEIRQSSKTPHPLSILYSNPHFLKDLCAQSETVRQVVAAYSSMEVVRSGGFSVPDASSPSNDFPSSANDAQSGYAVDARNDNNENSFGCNAPPIASSSTMELTITTESMPSERCELTLDKWELTPEKRKLEGLDKETVPPCEPPAPATSLPLSPL